MVKFGQIEVASKDFHKQRRITDIFTIDVNKVVFSDKGPCNNRKYWHHIAGYQVDGQTVISLFIKKPKYIFGYGVSQYDKNSSYTMSFNVFEAPEGVLQYRNIWNKVESQLFEKLATGPIKGEDKYIHGKLKQWEDCIKTNFHGQDIPYDMYCNAKAVLKIDSIYKQSKSYHPQIYVEESKYNNAESKQCNMLSDDNDGEFFEV